MTPPAIYAIVAGIFLLLFGAYLAFMVRYVEMRVAEEAAEADDLGE